MPPRQFRVNVVVTPEQHALLSELADLDPSVRSSSAFLRALLDRVTPLLRKTVPLMRAAAEELDTNREELRNALSEFMREMQQHDLLDAPSSDLAAARSAPSKARVHRAATRSGRTLG